MPISLLFCLIYLIIGFRCLLTLNGLREYDTFTRCVQSQHWLYLLWFGSSSLSLICSWPRPERRGTNEHQGFPDLHPGLSAAHRPDEIPPPGAARLHCGSLDGKATSYQAHWRVIVLLVSCENALRLPVCLFKGQGLFCYPKQSFSEETPSADKTALSLCVVSVTPLNIYCIWSTKQKLRFVCDVQLRISSLEKLLTFPTVTQIEALQVHWPAGSRTLAEQPLHSPCLRSDSCFYVGLFWSFWKCQAIVSMTFLCVHKNNTGPHSVDSLVWITLFW